MKCSSEIFVRNTKPILDFYISHNVECDWLELYVYMICAVRVT